MANMRLYENKLRDFLINKARNSTDLPTLIRKYGNIRFSMDCKKYDRPHFIVRIGISEAVFDIDSGLILAGGLGPESNDIKNWINKYLKKSEIKALWQTENKNYLAIKEKEEGQERKKNHS